MRTFHQRIAQWLVKFRWGLLIFGVILAAISYDRAGQLDFDRSIEKMFADDDPLLPPYYKLKETFGGNEVVGVVYTDEGLLAEDGSGIERLASITKRLRTVPGVQGVLSLAEINTVLDVIRKIGRTKSDKLCIVDPHSNLGANFREVFEKYTHGADGKTVAAVCMLYPQDRSVRDDVQVDETLVERFRSLRNELNESKEQSLIDKDEEAKAREVEIAKQLAEIGSMFPREKTIEMLREIAEDLPDGLSDAWVVGEPTMVVDGFNYVEEDGKRLGQWTTILLGVTILLFFRSVRWVVVPLLVVQLAILLTKATLVSSGLELSMVSSMLTAIVTVTGIATVIHITMRFRDAREQGAAPREAFEKSAARLIAPIFWSCTTTAAGFGSLLFAEVEPIQDFGLMMAIGSLFVLLSVVLVVPGLALAGTFGADPQQAWGERMMAGSLGKLIGIVETAPRTVAMVTLLVVATTIGGMQWLRVETDFTKNFRADTPIVESYQFVENNLGGAGVWDVILPAPKTTDNAAISDEYLDLVRRLEVRLRDIPIEEMESAPDLPSGWREHPAAHAGFSVAFPTAPGYTEQRSKDRLWTYTYQATDEDGVAYSVTAKELSAEQQSQGEQAVLDELADGDEGKATSGEKTELGGRAAYRARFEYTKKSEEWSVTRTSFVIGRWLYHLAVMGPVDALNEARQDEFLQSFRTVHPALTKVVSVADADEAIIIHPPRLRRFFGPTIRLNAMQSRITTFYKSMVNTSQTPGSVGYVRVMLRAPERQAAEQKLELIDRVQRAVRQELDTDDWVRYRAALQDPATVRSRVENVLQKKLDKAEYTEFSESITDLDDTAKILKTTEAAFEEHLDEKRYTELLRSFDLPEAETTGFFVLLTNLIRSITRDQWVCFAIATAAIALMTTIAFRNPVLALVALVPNALPILMVFGSMGWLGYWFDEVKLNMGAAMIAAVSIGLSVDSSIHYIIGFVRARDQGKSVREALDEVQQRVGRAAMFSTLALVIGFSVLCTSSFVPTIYFGVLVGLSMLGGLLGNLLVLPLLLRLVTREPAPTTST